MFASKNCRHFLPIAVALAASSASAEPIDPSLAHARVVGPPPGAHPVERVDPDRGGAARAPLPGSPRLLWRARAATSARAPVVVDTQGRIAIAGLSGTLSQVDAAGSLEWSMRFGSAAPIAGPVLTSDGRRALITAAGELMVVSDRGRPLARVPLPLRAARDVGDLLPTGSGGVILAAGTRLIELDRGGALVAETTTPEPARSLTMRGQRVLAVSERGTVFEWRAPAPARVLGSFGGRVTGRAAFTSEQHLTAVVGDKRLVDLNLRAGTRHLRFESSERLEGSPTVLPNGETRVTTADGLLLGSSRVGDETLRVAMELPGAPSTGALAATVDDGESVPTIVDGAGKTAFVRPGLDVGIVDAAGRVRLASDVSCIDPVALVPAGKARLALVCGSGHVFMIGDGKRPKRE